MKTQGSVCHTLCCCCPMCRFHVQCIDQWLSNRRLCPMCKHDASKPLNQPTAMDQAAILRPLGPRVTLSQLAVTLAGLRRVLRTHRCGFLHGRLPHGWLLCGHSPQAPCSCGGVGVGGKTGLCMGAPAAHHKTCSSWVWCTQI